MTVNDDARIRRGISPEVSAAMRRMVLNILQQDTTIKDNVHGKRMRAGWNLDFFETMYAAFTAA